MAVSSFLNPENVTHFAQEIREWFSCREAFDRTTLPSAARPTARRHYIIIGVFGAATFLCANWLGNLSPASAVHFVIGPTCDLSDSAKPIYKTPYNRDRCSE